MIESQPQAKQGVLVPTESLDSSLPETRPDNSQNNKNSLAAQKGELPAPYSTSLPGRLPNTNSSIGSGHNAAGESAAAAQPKPLCSALVLNVKSRFRMRFDHLDNASGAVPIFAENSSKVLLLAHVEMYANNRGGSVSLALTEQKTLLGTIQSTGSGFMRITDRRDKHYGDFKYSGNLVYTLFTGGKESATLKYERGAASSGLVSLITMSGKQLAQASKCKGDKALEGPKVEYLEVKVDTGVDSVLALLCIIGAMALG